MHSRDHVTPDRALEKQRPCLAPADQPVTVRELAERLLPAYTVDEGTVHLAGCLLEDRLFVRAGVKKGPQPVELFLDEQGNEVEPAMVDSLGLGRTVTLERPPEHDEQTIERLAAQGRQMVIERLDTAQNETETIDVAAVWCKFAEGKLRFTIGESTADLPFADWARELQPPPFVCPHSNHQTYHLAATDDGRIVAAERVVCCAQSGQRMLTGDLVTCATTGRRVLPHFTETCPVTGETVLRDELVACGTCGQEVAPGAMRGANCEACDRLEPVNKADPRLARVLDVHPVLDRWRHWRLSESVTSYHLTARGWLRQILLIVDKDSLDLKRVATGSRLRSGWNVVERSRYDYVLRG